MNRLESSILLSFLLATPALSAAAQDSVSGDGAMRTRRAFGVVDGIGSPPFSEGRGFVGEHTLTPTSPGQSRLVFVLQRWVSDSADPSAFAGIGSHSVVDEYLLDELGSGVQHGLFGLSIVDRVVSRAMESSRRVEFEHAIEMEGPDALVKSALDWLQRFVAKNRGMITLKLIFTTRAVDDDDLGRLPGDGAPQVSLVDAKERDALAETLMNREHTNVLVSPLLTVYGGQRGVVSCVNQTSYIGDFDLTIAHGAMIADPIVNVFNDGLVWDVTAILDPDSDSILLSTQANITMLRRPMRTLETQLAANLEPVTIQLPEFDEARWESSRVELTSRERAIHVTGLRLTTWDESGDPRLQEIELLIGIEEVIPDSRRDPSGTIGMVLGVDGSTGKVFLRGTDPNGFDATISARRIVLERDGSAVGECTVIEAIDGVLVLRLEQGEAKAGDSAK